MPTSRFNHPTRIIPSWPHGIQARYGANLLGGFMRSQHFLRTEGLMSLRTGTWTPASIHNVVAEFIASEPNRYTGLPSAWQAVIDHPDTTDPRQNHLRLRLLYYARLELMAEIPPDTTWHEVHALTEHDLGDLRIMARCGWDTPSDRNELLLAARRLPKEPLRAVPSSWKKPILWGHDVHGPWTILEGNHRLMAYAANDMPAPLSVPVLLGLSPTPCLWHLPDEPGMLANDLIVRPRPPFAY